MKLSFFVLFLCWLQLGLGQSSQLVIRSFTENTSEQEKFTTYLDSINKYLYRDVKITEQAFKKCQEIIDNKIELSDSLTLEYILSKIYFAHSKTKPLEAYKLIAESEPFLSEWQVTQPQVASFKYLKSFTYMAIGDIESAIKAYHKNLTEAISIKDTSAIISSSYSLGQLYNDEKDFKGAIKLFQKILKYQETIKIRPSTISLVQLELSEAYFGLGQNHKVLETLKKANEVTKEHNLKILECETLILIGKLYIEENKIAAAEQIYTQLAEASEGAQDEGVKRDAKTLQSQLFKAQKKYKEALIIEKSIIATIDSTDLDRRMEAFQSAHALSILLGDYKGGYHYLLKNQELNTKKEERLKKQKTSYHKIKFEAEEKEKENATLTMKVNQSKAKGKILYLYLALLSLILVFLFVAFYQKKRYSLKLEEQVQKKTINLVSSNELLNQSNKELKEFNRILSHDLIEPVRNIIGFSQLAEREEIANVKTKEYLGHISNSGEQLRDLIKSIELFQIENTMDISQTEEINLGSLINQITGTLKKSYPLKLINVKTESDEKIVLHLNSLKSILRVILDNAIRYNENKEVNISVNYFLENMMHTIEISDNGIGIAQKYHEQTFKLFKRLHNREKYKGAGIGLNIAQKLAVRLNGSIYIKESEENEGTTFVVKLPNR